MKLIGLMMFLVGMATVLSATPNAPEIDASSAGSVVPLLAGAFLVIKGRRRR
jgi:hypothetical protein